MGEGAGEDGQGFGQANTDPVGAAARDALQREEPARAQHRAAALPSHHERRQQQQPQQSSRLLVM